MNRRFPVLSVISYLLRFVGWLFLAFGVLWPLLSILLSHPMTLLDFGIVTFLVGYGLLVAAAGESIQVFFAIEDNTHAAAEHLFKIASEKSTPKDTTNQ